MEIQVILIQEKAVENAMCEISAILSLPQMCWN